MNVAGAVGLGLSLVALILIAVGGALPHFVDVFLVRVADDADDSNEIAGVGVFSSVYDATVLDPAIVAESGVPNDKFDTPTLEFPLLFPAQENFVADVLPITAEQVIALDEALGAGGTVSDPVVILIDAIAALEFESCTDYFDDQFTNLNDLFDQFQTSTIPISFFAVSTDAAESFDRGIAATFAVLGDESNIHRTLVTALASFAASCGGVDTVDTDNSVKNCVADILSNFASAASASQADALAFTMSAVATYLSSGAVSGFSVNQALFLEVSYFMDTDVVLSTNTVAFTDNPDSLADFCDFIPPTSLAGQCTIIDYMQGSALVWSQAAVFMLELSSAAAPLAAALGDSAGAVAAYLGSINTGLISNGNTIEANGASSAGGALASTVTLLPLVESGADYSGHCRFIQAAQAAAGADFEVPAAGPCTFAEYLVGLPLLLEFQENDLASTVGLIAGLYGDCFAAVPTVLLCPTVFTYGLLDGAYSGDIGIEASDFALPEGSQRFRARGVEQCEEDATDNEKVAQAQVMIIVGYVFYSLGLLVAIGALVASNPFLFGISGVFGVLAGVLVIGALLVVQSAPVYENVGVEPELADGQSPEDLDLAPLYVSGPVALLALSSAAVEILAGILFFVAACLAAKQTKDGPAGENLEQPEKKEKKTAEVEEVIPEAQKVEEIEGKGDVVPGTNVSI